MYQYLITTLLFFHKDPETVHRMALGFLKILGHEPFSTLVHTLFDIRCRVLEQVVWGLSFKSPVGLAGGFDKNGEAVRGLAALGFGFIEVGTVTRHAQPGNPRPRIFRYPQDQAVINRMGFNNHGADALRLNLEKMGTLSVPLGISLGKSKVTSLEEAADDYLYSYKTLYEYGDYFVINVSSPNTPGLRQLQDKDFLIGICRKLNTFRNAQKARKPLFVKIAPDLTNEAVDDVLTVILDQKIDGIIATNTTIGREGLSVQTQETGGLSGRPVKNRSTEIIRYIRSKVPTLPIIGVGGIFTAEDAYEKIKAGASLVQIYTGFIYGGPFTIAHIDRGLARLLKRDGYKNIREATGKG